MNADFDEDNRLPASDWTLAEWFEKAGAKTDKEVIDIASESGITPPDNPWSPQRISEWKNGRGNRPPGMLDRPTALKMIEALRACATRNQRSLFRNDKLEEQARIFLRSRACVHKFAQLDENEIWQICKDKIPVMAPVQTPHTLAALRQKIQPAPPLNLFGRDDDIERVLHDLSEYPVSAIDGIGGEGKTALAWYSAVRARNELLVQDVDWVTDKRYLIDIHGNVQKITADENHANFFEKICKSMVRRFGWTELYGALGSRLINGCADRLRSGRYLIVCDNLETVESSDALVRQLHDMLAPTMKYEPVSSRALITSRTRVDFPQCKNIALSGIAPDPAAEFINYLQVIWDVVNPMSDDNIMKLARLARGNPLLIQILVRRYALSPSKETYKTIIDSLESGEMTFFDSVFSPLFDRLSATSRKFATYLAAELTFAQTTITDQDLRVTWNALNVASDVDYITTIRELIKNRIVTWDSNNGYHMHSLIRAYLFRFNDE